MSRVVDTSVLYAAFDQADPRQKEAEGQLARAEPILIPTPVLSEFVGLLQYRHGHHTATQVLEDLMRLGNVQFIACRHPDQAIAIWKDAPDISLTDAVGIHMARETSSHLLTFDQRQITLHDSLQEAA